MTLQIQIINVSLICAFTGDKW